MQVPFHAFVAKFPPVSMPVTLGEDTHHVFSVENEQFTAEMVAQYIEAAPETHNGEDDYIEYVPCFAIDDTEQFIALVWWKADLLNYEYVLATYDVQGNPLDRKVIAFTRVEGDVIHRAVATIDADWVIFIGEGRAQGDHEQFDPGTSKTYELEIMADGKIL